jgi:RHS repeat-associated protein
MLEITVDATLTGLKLLSFFHLEENSFLGTSQYASYFPKGGSELAAMSLPRTDILEGTFSLVGEPDVFAHAFEGDITGLVEEVAEQAQSALTAFADRDDVEGALVTAFGTTIDESAVADLLTNWSSGNFEDFPEIEVVTEGTLGNAFGAFAAETGKIYLAADFLTAHSGTIDRIADVVLEEYGHAVDSWVNAEDSPGDEGSIFAAVVRGEALNAQQLAMLKTEDDTVRVELDGQVVSIEQASVSDSGGPEGSQTTLVLEESGGVPLAIQYEMFTIKDRLIVRYEGQNIVDTNFVSGSRTLKVNVPDGTSNIVDIVLATNDENTAWNYSATTDLSSLPDTGDAGPSTTDARDTDEEKRNEETGCEDCKATASATSEVELHSGAVIETHDLISYQSLGSVRGLTLQYDSLRADPSKILYFGYDAVPTHQNLSLVAELEVSRGANTFQVPGYQGTDFGLDGGEHLWSITGDTLVSDVSAALQVDLSTSETGVYTYALTRGLKELTNGVFTDALSGASDVESGQFINVNSINSPFGSGWGLAGLQQLVENPDGSILLVDGDGSELLFQPPANPGEAYIAPPGDFSSLERLGDGTFSRTFRDRTVATFNASHLLETVTDSNGNQTRYLYNADGHLTQMVDPVGLTTTLGYSSGKVTSITDPQGRVTQLAYDDAGNLIRVTDPDGSARTWEYDAEHRMTAETDQRNNREQMVYDFAGRADSAILKDGSLLDFNPVQSQGLYPASQTIDPANAPAAFVLSDDPIATYVDANGRRITNVLDQMGQVVASFDEEGALPTVTRNAENLVAAQTDTRGNPTSFTYDAFGNVTSIQDVISGNATRTFTYDPTFNQLTSVTDELGRQTLHEIDPNNGNVLSVTEVVGAVGGDDDLVTRFTYTPQGLVDLVIDPLGRVTDNDYNPFGLLTAITFAKGTADAATQRYTYDAAGNQTALIDENGNRTEFTYDALNRLTRIVEADPDGAGVLTSPVTQFTYDAAGNLVTVTDALGNVTTNSYDALNRLNRISDALNQVTTFDYDNLGNLLSVIDPLGHQTTNRYDARSRLVDTTDPDGGVTRFGYDLDNNLTSVIDPSLNQTTFAYDARDRLVAETDPLGKTTRYQYDLVNNLTARTDRNGRTIGYDYDDIDRLTREIWKGSSQVIDYTYDKASNLTAIADESSSLAFTYDNRDRVTEVDNAGTPNAPNAVLDYAYDDAGNLLSLADTINGISGGTNAYAYDDLNRLTRLTQTGNAVSNKRVDFGYNALGQYTSIDRYANLGGTQSVVDTSFGYDALNRLENLTHRNSSNPVAFYDFAYDGASRITQVTDIDGSTDYTYDDRDQLIGADRSNPNNPDESYGYDANGNRINSSLHGAGYETGNGNRLASDGTYRYEYDNEGNLIRKTAIATNETQEFEWDYRNRLVAVVDKDASGAETQRVEFTYDAFDRRVAKEVDANPQDAVPAEVTHFVYDGSDVLLEFADNDGRAGANPPELAQRYLHGASVDQILAQDDGNGGVLWQLTDKLGTVRDLVNNSSTVVNHITYDSFGNVVSKTNPLIDTRYLFTGREFDGEIGLQYNRARYYDPTVGRFIGEDPIGFAGGDANFYRYARNDSINHLDPTGLVLDTAIDIGAILYDLYRLGKDNIFGDCNNLGENLSALGLDVVAAAIPFATGAGAGVRTASKVSDTLKSSQNVTEGIYEFHAKTSLRYVGQSKDINKRLPQHIQSGKLEESELPKVLRTEVLGGKTQREIAEQRRIEDLGGIKNLENKRNPIGPKRMHLLD